MAYYAENQKRYEQSLSEADKRERRRKKQYSSTKSYIRLHATIEELEELESLINSKKDELTS